jgi:hypothetical protein
MKNIKYIIFGSFLTLVLTTSCAEDALELDPISTSYTEEFYKTENDVYGLVIGTYDGLQNIPLREFTLTEMRSDNAISRLHEGEYQQLETFEVQATNSVSTNYYAVNFNVIFRANKVLDNMALVTTAANKTLFPAEAKFARALAYFNLVRAYGEVPLVDQVITSEQTEYYAKKPITAIYALIESDLNVAIAGLPTKTSSTVPIFGRASKQAAQGMLAKVYLTQGKYSLALPLLSSLVASPASIYALQTSYASVFSTEGNNEIVFAIPYTTNSRLEGQDFSWEMTTSGGANGLNFATPNFRTFMTASTGDTRTAVNINLTIASTNVSYGQNGKFIPNGAAFSGNDWVVLRLSDIYLMYTEAVMGTSSSTTDSNAVKYYNLVRKRAIPTAIDATTVTKTMLLNERRYEFAFENQRLYDLIRFGEANTVLSTYAPSTFTPTKDLLLPLPQDQINVSKGLLIQNPLY